MFCLNISHPDRELYFSAQVNHIYSNDSSNSFGFILITSSFHLILIFRWHLGSEDIWNLEYFRQILVRIERQCAAYSFKEINLTTESSDDQLSISGNYSPFGLPLSSSAPATVTPLLSQRKEKDDFHVFSQFSSKADKVAIYSLIEILCIPLHPTSSLLFFFFFLSYYISLLLFFSRCSFSPLTWIR